MADDNQDSKGFTGLFQNPQLFSTLAGIGQALQNSQQADANRKIAATMMAFSPWTGMGHEAASMIPSTQKNTFDPILAGVTGGARDALNQQQLAQYQKQLQPLLQAIMHNQNANEPITNPLAWGDVPFNSSVPTPPLPGGK